MKYPTAVMCFTLSVLSGCGTINTVVLGDEVVKRDLDRAGTYCKSIPRIYSGVAYDFCHLNGEPSYETFWSASNTVPWPLADLGFSGVFDTAVLPYTIYMQSTEGSLTLN